MNFKTTIILLVLLLFVSAYFVFVEIKSDTTHDREQIRSDRGKKGELLFAADKLAAGSVVELRIKKPDETVTLAKEGTDWWQTDPVRWALNTWDANKIPQMVADLRYVQKFTPGKGDAPSLEKVQLAPAARAVVELKVEGDDSGDARTVVVSLGRKLVGQGYVMIDGDPLVYVVGSEMHDKILDSSINDWRNKAIDGVKEGQADHVRLVHGGEAFEAAKSDGDWSLVAPHSGRVDRKVVSTLLDGVDGLYVTKFIADRPEDLTTFGLDKPDRVVVIRKPAPDPAATQPADDPETPSGDESPSNTSEPEHYTLRVGSTVDLTNEGFFATWEQAGQGADVVFSLPKSSVEKLHKKVDDLRDPRITIMDASDVSQLKIVAAGQAERFLVRTEDRWQFEPGSDPGFAADNGETAAMVTAIMDAKAEGYRPHFEPAGEPAATVTLGALARPEPDVLTLYAVKDDKNKHLVIRNNESTGYLVKEDDLSRLFGPLSDLRDRLVLDIEKDTIGRVTLRRPDEVEFVFDRELPPSALPDEAGQVPAQATAEDSEATAPRPDTQPAAPTVPGPWTLTGQEKFETSALDDLINNLLPLRATKWLPGDSGPPPSSSDAYRLVVQPRGAEDVTVLIDATTRRASVTGIDMAFEVSESLSEAVDAEFRHRTVLPLSTTDIETVSVSRSDATVILKKDDNGDFTGDGSEKIDQSAAGGLFDTLAGLRVERYLAQGATTKDGGITINVTLKDGQSHVVSVAAGDQEPYRITIGSRAYNISVDVFDKLTAPLIEKEEDGE